MLSIQSQKKKFLFAAVFWAGLLMILALLPEKAALMVLRKPVFFSVAHVSAYFFLAVLLCLYFRFQRVFLAFRMQNAMIFCFTLIFCMLCGGITEAIQVLTPDRGPDWYDLQCDLLGTISGIFFFFLFLKIRSCRKFTFLRQILPSLSSH